MTKPLTPPAPHPAYTAALKADEAFQAELVRVYGPAKAPDARYRTAGFSDAGVRAAYKAKLDADAAWLKVMRSGPGAEGGVM